jgi:hypothetical protein
MRVHLVTYGTARFWHRQRILGWSARAHGVADTVTHWNPARLRHHGFDQLAPEISLHERGSGFWSWKPYIIHQALMNVPDGDVVFYCDVGRRFPFKILDRPLAPFLEWMQKSEQSFMPGLRITWRGPLSVWTKRDAFVLTGNDAEPAWNAPTIQASFSLWKAGNASVDFISRWLKLCANRTLISDDPDTCGLPSLPGFHEHRHDQSLLSLLCFQSEVAGFDTGPDSSPIDTRDPSAVIGHYFKIPPLPSPPLWGACKPLVMTMEATEKSLRHIFHFNEDLPSHPLAAD